MMAVKPTLYSGSTNDIKKHQNSFLQLNTTEKHCRHYFLFRSKLCRHNWAIRTNREDNVTRILLGLVNALQRKDQQSYIPASVDTSVK